MDDAQKYLANQIDSCSIEEIVIMLINRAIKYINDIKKAIDDKDVEKRFFALTKVSDILSFLVVNIKEDKLPSLCKILRICFNKLIYIDRHKDKEQADDLIRVLKIVKESFYAKIKK